MSKNTEEIKVKKIRKKLHGVVVSVKKLHNITVRVESKFKHVLYDKIVKRHKKYSAYCDDSSVKEGDLVIIEEGKPLSRHTSFYFVQKVDKK